MLVAAVGNRWLKDQGFGIHVIDRLAGFGLPAGVELAAWECGVIAAFQHLYGRTYDRAIFLTAVARGRQPGTLHHTRGETVSAVAAEVHGRIGDSVMGLVALENLLIIAEHYGCLPDDVVVIEAEPADDSWGSELSPPVAPLVDDAVNAVLAALVRHPARGGIG